MQYGADAQKILQIAAEKARGLGHSYVGSAHLLLALAGSEGFAGRLLRGAGVEEETLWCMAVVLYGRGTPGLPLPQGFSLQAQRVLRNAAGEAKQLGQRQIEVAHILLSLLREEQSEARVLLILSSVDTECLFSRAVDSFL